MPALSDIVVLDLTHMLSGPYGAMLLSDLGARTIKVEPPGAGEATRAGLLAHARRGHVQRFVAMSRAERARQRSQGKREQRFENLHERFLPGTSTACVASS